MIDYHALQSELKQQLLARWQGLDVASDPLPFTWIMRAFSCEGIAINPPLAQARTQGQRWLEEDTAWSSDANLGSIGMLYTVLGEPDDQFWQERIPTFIERVQHLCARGVSKFSPLNDPEVVFGIAHIAKCSFPPDLIAALRSHCIRNASATNVRRAVLFTAAAHEVGATVTPLNINVNDLDGHELIPVMWLAEQYPELIDGEARRREVWEAYERLKESIPLDELNPIELAMLYEAVVQEVQGTDVVTLFNNFPWHPEIQKAASSLFLKGEYVAAVFEAAKLFVDTVKHRAGHPHDKAGNPLDGGKLMAHVFSGNSPRLKFTTLSTQTEQNEHRGLALIAEGIVSALRNPKGHLPRSAITLSPEEALEQLAIISYLMRRLDSATP